jgi:hypothetical protein
MSSRFDVDSTPLIYRCMWTGPFTWNSERRFKTWVGNRWKETHRVVRGKEIIWQMFWNRFNAVIIRPHRLNIAFTYVSHKYMVGALYISSPLKPLRHSYSIFRRTDGRVVALVILVYASHKPEVGTTRSSCTDISWWKNEGLLKWNLYGDYPVHLMPYSTNNTNYQSQQCILFVILQVSVWICCQYSQNRHDILKQKSALTIRVHATVPGKRVGLHGHVLQRRAESSRRFKMGTQTSSVLPTDPEVPGSIPGAIRFYE